MRLESGRWPGWWYERILHSHLVTRVETFRTRFSCRILHAFIRRFWMLITCLLSIFSSWRLYPTHGQHCWLWLQMLSTTSVLTPEIFVGSAEIMRITDVWTVSAAESLLMRSPVDTLTDLESQTVLVLFIMTDLNMELMWARICIMATWRLERMEALILVIRVGAAIARGNEDLCRMTLNHMQSDSRWTYEEIANDWEDLYGELQVI